jgi:hypothetical protein
MFHVGKVTPKSHQRERKISWEKFRNPKIGAHHDTTAARRPRINFACRSLYRARFRSRHFLDRSVDLLATAICASCTQLATPPMRCGSVDQ